MTLAEIDRSTRDSRGTDSALRDWVRALEATAPIAGNPQRILLDAISEAAQSHGDAAALISERGTLTYRELVERSRRYARWALGQNLAKGQTVCLMMPNRPEYMAVWLGITSVGGVVSLVNTQLRGPSLKHCVDIVAPAHVIVADQCIAQLRTAPLSGRPKIWSFGSCEYSPIDGEIERLSAAPLTEAERRATTIADRALTIYTSGTTGLPKAANVSHRRLMQWSLWFAGLTNIGPSDRMYNCLPMYHSIGGVVATGALLVRGGSVVIREKFSASAFWDDIAVWDCTLFQYIGELCRYLVDAPKHRREHDHRLRLCCGNGLRAAVWREFQSRFAMPRILEFYAATEGNVSLYNVEGKVGAIGRVPPFLTHRFPLAVVKFNPVTGEPMRDGAGRAIRCATNEAGEAIGRIGRGAANAGSGAFEGYTGAADTERKILRNVFEPGDAWYRSGDLMRMDEGGFYYFVDRIGDTFRWKGENVAASEVAAALMECPGVNDAAVYGVAIPGAEGAAGMAALVADAAIDLTTLRRHVVERLPAYARPLFLRLNDKIDTTSTFKPKTHELKREGFDPALVRDRIYVDDWERQAYVPLDPALYRRIAAGRFRL